MRNWLWRLLAAALFIAPGIMGMGAQAAYAAAAQLPFSGTYSGTAVFRSDGTPIFSGAGHATYLGQSTSDGYSVFTSAPVDCAGGVPNDNYETFTAASGDTFEIVSHDVACPTGPYQYHGTGNWNVIPGTGTGHFMGITGQGTFDGNSDFNQGVFSFKMMGTISMP
jgi:hypothetical protein